MSKEEGLYEENVSGITTITLLLVAVVLKYAPQFALLAFSAGFLVNFYEAKAYYDKNKYIAIAFALFATIYFVLTVIYVAVRLNTII